MDVLFVDGYKSRCGVDQLLRLKLGVDENIVLGSDSRIFTAGQHVEVSNPGLPPHRGAVLCFEKDGWHKVLFPGNKQSLCCASSMQLLWQRCQASREESIDNVTMPSCTDSLPQNGMQRFETCLHHILEARVFPFSDFPAPAHVSFSWDCTVVRLICDMLKSHGNGAIQIPDEELLLNHIQMVRVTMIHQITSSRELDSETLESVRVVAAACRDY